jgi:hypothetical protein
MPSENNPRLDPNEAPKQAFPVPSGIGQLITLVDQCWVCNGVFPEYGGRNGTLVQEFHHPVPRAFGGAGGPVISICSGHHATAHDVSLRLFAGVPYHDLVGHEPLPIQQRIVHLASIIVRAMNLFKEDPNRIVPIQYGLPYTKNEQLKLAARSRKISVKQLLDRILSDFLDKEFPQRRPKKP